jgi:hypothetical protein
MKFKLRTLIFVLLSFGIGIGVRPAIDVLRNLACDIECKAQLLYKNTVFFEVREVIANIKKNPTVKVAVDKTRYTQEYLRDSGIDMLVVLESGEFLVTSRLDKLAMLAKPIYEENRLIWRCQFFSEAAKSPAERACSH